MKIKFLLTAGVSAMLGTICANAQSAPTGTDADLFLTIRNTVDSSAYVVDLGSGFTFGSSFNLSIPGLTTDVNAIADVSSAGDWTTNPNVVFSVFGQVSGVAGGLHPNLSAYATDPTSAVWLSSHSEGSISSGIGGFSNGFDGETGGNTASGLDTNAVIEGAGDNSSYKNFLGGAGTPNSAAFGYFSPDVEGSITSGALPLDFVPTSPSGTSPAGTVEGTFTIDSAHNQLDFTAAPVPEPSTIAGVIMGGAALLTAARRRRA